MTTSVEWIEEVLTCGNEGLSFARQEVESWQSLRDEVKRSPPATARTTTGERTESGSWTPPETLRRRYEETAMSSSDYDKPYNDTVYESLQAEFEFGRTVASTNPAEPAGDDQRPYKTQGTYATLLQAEHGSLQDAERQLNDVESKLDSSTHRSGCLSRYAHPCLDRSRRTGGPLTMGRGRTAAVSG